MNSLQVGSERVKVSIIALRPSNAGPTLVFRCILDNGQISAINKGPCRPTLREKSKRLCFLAATRTSMTSLATSGRSSVIQCLVEQGRKVSSRTARRPCDCNVDHCGRRACSVTLWLCNSFADVS